MKKILFIFIAFFSLLSLAQVSKNVEELSHNQELGLRVNSLGKCSYSRKQLTNAHLAQKYNTKLKEKFEYLRYENLQPHWNCIFLKRNLKRDLRRFYIPYHEFENKLKNEKKSLKSVSGKIRYVGFVPKKYRYDIQVQDGVATAIVKVHFDMKDFSLDVSTAKRMMDIKIADAQRYWNSKTPARYQFKFSRVKNQRDAHFSVRLKRKFTRGPYDTRWSLDWSSETVAHELGHMMGLDDEYDQITGSTLSDINRLLISRTNRDHLSTFSDRYMFGYYKAMKCDQDSLMCNSYNGDIRAWHLYSIFKRFYQ
jgi:hypothetical protein